MAVAAWSRGVPSLALPRSAHLPAVPIQLCPAAATELTHSSTARLVAAVAYEPRFDEADSRAKLRVFEPHIDP